MVQEISSPDIIIQQKGTLGHVILNRPLALNALNIDMIRGLTYALNEWEHNPDISAVLIEGAGERAFCAGGDIKGFYNAGMDYRRGKLNFDALMLFFKEEYALNKRLFHFEKPIVSYMNGITMGGGYGIAGNCKYRVVCENTTFAMPETKIGFFPDVGSMYHLTRARNGMGLFLAITGEVIPSGDMLDYELADYFVPMENKNLLIETLASISHNYKQEAVLDSLAQVGGERISLARKLNSFAKYLENFCNERKSISGYIVALEQYEQQTQIQTGLLKSIKHNSPLSMSVSFEYFKRAQNMSFDEIIKQDYLLACNFAKKSDFYEGIRAAVIDKDKMPNWTNKHYLGNNSNDLDLYFV